MLNNIWLVAEIITGMGVFIAGVGYAWGQLRQGKNKSAKDLSDILSDLLKARDTKIKDLEDAMQDNVKKIASLEGQVKVLTAKKGDLEDIIYQALASFFESHPELAKEIHQKINS